MSQQPQAPHYGAPPSSQAPPSNYQQQQLGSYTHHSAGGNVANSTYNQPPQGSWGPPTSASGGQKPQPLLPKRELFTTTLSFTVIISCLRVAFVFLLLTVHVYVYVKVTDRRCTLFSLNENQV